MNNTFWMLIAAVAVMQSAASAAFADGYIPLDTKKLNKLASLMVTAGDSVYVVTPPVLVSEPAVSLVEWSSDGKHAVLLREKSSLTPKQMQALMKQKQDREAYREVMQGGMGETELLIYSRGKLYAIWKGPVATSEVTSTEWLTGGLFCGVVRSTQGEKPGSEMFVVRISGSKVTTSRLTMAYEDAGEWTISPNRTTLAVVSNRKLYLFRSHGEDAIIDMPAEDTALDWAADGNEPCLISSGSQNPRYYAVQGNQLVRHEGEPKLSDGETPRPKPGGLALVTQNVPVKLEEQGGRVKSLWLRINSSTGKPAPYLVAGDVISGKLSPDGSSILYITSEGSAYLRGIVPADMKPDDVTEAKNQAIRSELMSDVRQIGIGLQMCAQNNKGSYPEPGQFSEAMRNYMLVEVPGFQYTFAGGQIAADQNMANIEMGYVPGPGGVAVIYADCHSAWRPDKQ